MVVGRDALLRLVKALPDPVVGVVAVLGVDDFALRRGRVYGTVLVDMASHRPVDVLADREAATFADWLTAHPGVQVICRDRAGAYAEGARTGAPAAVQVADRWHLWHNLCEHVEKLVARHRGALHDTPEPPPTVAQQGPALPPVGPEEIAVGRAEAKVLAVRTRARHEQVQALVADGVALKEIGRRLGLARDTVRRFARAARVEDLLASGPRPTLLDDHIEYVHHRWNEGVTNAIVLDRELRARGYRGSYQTLSGYLRPLRGQQRLPVLPGPPKVREVVG